MAKSHRARKRKKAPAWSSVLLISTLSAAAVATSYAAISSVSSGDHEGLPVVAPSAETVVEGTSPSPSSAAPVTSAEQSEDFREDRLMAASGDLVMRAMSGTCADAGTVEISLDGGRSWEASASPADTGATQILRLLPLGPFLQEVVALDDACDPQIYSTRDQGATWAGPAPVLGTWFFDSTTPTVVGAPEGPQELPCEGIELSASGDRAVVRCDDGTLVTSNDRGLTWRTLETSEAIAVALADDSYVVAYPGDENCDGVRTSQLDLSGNPITAGCFEPENRGEQVNFDQVVVAQTGITTLLWMGEELAISMDGGSSWL